jgi:hypothetical protein
MERKSERGSACRDPKPCSLALRDWQWRASAATAAIQERNKASNFIAKPEIDQAIIKFEE